MVESPHRLSTATTLLSASQFERNIDHGCDDRGSSFRVPGVQPFVDDQEIHIAKKQHKKDYLRNGLKQDIPFFLPIKLVNSFHDNPKSHVNNSNNHSYFHFQAISE